MEGEGSFLCARWVSSYAEGPHPDGAFGYTHTAQSGKSVYRSSIGQSARMAREIAPHRPTAAAYLHITVSARHARSVLPRSRHYNTCFLAERFACQAEQALTVLKCRARYSPLRRLQLFASPTRFRSHRDYRAEKEREIERREWQSLTCSLPVRTMDWTPSVRSEGSALPCPACSTDQGRG